MWKYNQRDTEDTEKKCKGVSSKQIILRLINTEFSIARLLSPPSLCSLCLCGEFQKCYDIGRIAQNDPRRARR
jgi:hypothetical protein